MLHCPLGALHVQSSGEFVIWSALRASAVDPCGCRVVPYSVASRFFWRRVSVEGAREARIRPQMADFEPFWALVAISLADGTCQKARVLPPLASKSERFARGLDRN